MIIQAQKNICNSQVSFQVTDFYDFKQTGFDFAIAYSAYPHVSDKRDFVN